MYKDYVVGRFLKDSRIEMIKVGEETGRLDYDNVEILNLAELSKEEVFDILTRQIEMHRETIDYLENELHEADDAPIMLASEEEQIAQAMLESSFEAYLH